VNAFFTDLLHDLREKKLWPVAAVLLLALVAAPALLLKSSSADSGDAPVTPPAQAAPGAAEAALVTLADGSTADASDLESFDEKNPFGDGRDAAPSTDAGSELPTPEDLDELFGGGAEEPASGDAPGAGSPSPPAAPPSGDGGDDTPAKPVAYAYEVDVRFGRRDGEPRLYRGLQRLDVLPRSAAPLLVFLGVSPTGKTAIFLLDSSVSQNGDGRCQPSKDECTFIHLNAERNHDLHFLTTEDGREYAIRLLEIRKERVDRRARSSRAARSARGARGARARSAARREKRRRPALGADEIVYER
jgi:hypothetical protein